MNGLVDSFLMKRQQYSQHTRKLKKKNKTARPVKTDQKCARTLNDKPFTTPSGNLRRMGNQYTCFFCVSHVYDMTIE